MSEFGKVSTIYGIRDLILPALILSHAPDDLTKLLTLSSRDLAMCAVNLKRAQLRHCNVLPMMLVMHMTAALGQPLTFEIRNTRPDLLAGHHTAGLHLLWLGMYVGRLRSISDGNFLHGVTRSGLSGSCAAALYPFHIREATGGVAV